MALVLTVEAARWRARLEQLVDQLGDRLTPVVKGNGYGFGRAVLTATVAELGLFEVAVGTVDELDLDAAIGQLVLTPTLDPRVETFGATVTLTVGSVAGARAVAGHRGPLAVKLLSSMRRYGAAPEELPGLLDELDRTPACAMLHLPLAGTDDDRLGEIEAWLPHLSAGLPLSVSHLGIDSFLALCSRHPQREIRWRAGTALWHGEREALQLGAEVLDVRPLPSGTPCGYRLTPTPTDGAIVLVAAGTAHGVHPLPDGRSPLHFARTRMALIEPPHMHTSIAFVPDGEPCPAVGEVVDVQRPLTQVRPDRIVWVR